MKIVKSFLLALSIIAGSFGIAAAQVIIRVQPQSDQQITSTDDERDYTALLKEVFARITDELNLTNEQKFKMVAIVSETVLNADPLMDKLDELDSELDEAAIATPFDEDRVPQLAAQQAQVMGQIIAMKAKAKAALYRLLTVEQRNIVARQFRIKANLGSLGAISN